MGHSFYGKENSQAKERLKVTIDGHADTSPIVSYLKKSGAFGLVEVDLGITTILVSCLDSTALQETLMERWGDLPGFRIE